LPLLKWPSSLPLNGESADIAGLVKEYKHYLRVSKIPKLLFYGEPGAFLPKSTVKWCIDNLLPLTTVNIGPGIHFLQEDNTDLIGRQIHHWLKLY
jgi:haloalkane dehalogenase